VTDVFHEVDEQLRSQRLEDWLRRGWPFVAAAAGAALLVALGVWGWSKHEADEAAKASIAYQAGLDAAQRGDAANAEKGFAEAAASSSPAYRTLGLMQEAQLRLDQKRLDDGVRLLDEAAKAAPDEILRDAAKLKAGMALMDARPLSDVEPRLKPLADGKGPFRTLAMEALAMAWLQAGRLEQAKGEFSVLTLTQGVSPAAQARAHAAIDLINSGSASVVPAAVKAALALPPQPALIPPPTAQDAGAAQ
jgi:hypothetical protein